MVNNYIYKLLSIIKPKYRRLLLLILDSIIFNLSIFLSLTIFRNNLISSQNNIFIYIFLTLIGLLIYCFSGQYRALTRYVGSSSLYFLTLRNLVMIVMTIILGFIFNVYIFDIRFWVILWLLINSFTGYLRLTLRDILLELKFQSNKKIKRVAIYGAGEAGGQLAISLRVNKTFIIKTFIDDNSSLWGRSIYGVNIISPKDIYKLKNQIDLILFAIPSIDLLRKKRIFSFLKDLEIPILQIPSIDDLLNRGASINELSPINIEELLGRKRVNPDKKLLGPGITNSVVFVTGAGGSIGSEICRQLLKLRPKTLLLFDSSEENLYKINQELNQIKDPTNNLLITPILGNAADIKLLRAVFSEFDVNILFHAAAYKHVPLIENNKLSGIENNVLSSLSICKVAEEFNIDKAILISSDKAVRPTNVMGATKRISELLWQTYAKRSINNKSTNFSKNTIFAMVRFGNVLDSSGSVVPLFKKQIKNGGPLTVTHKDVIRFFMTIPEAAELVIQSSVIAKGGDILILDMGDPIKIIDLAKQMINLSGLSVKDKKNKNGDIEIIFTGLREGEKLFEELLIEGKSQITVHPRILKAREGSISEDKLFLKIDMLKKFISLRNLENALKIIKEIIPEWNYKNFIN